MQVHPSDEYALVREGQLGKTEMWLILEAEEGAGIYLGLNRYTSPEEFRRDSEDGTVESLLAFRRVKAGEVYFIPAGTVHAICEGVMIYEIQQNSTLTYRLYDYMRRGGEGRLRELHPDRAMDVAELRPRHRANGCFNSNPAKQDFIAKRLHPPQVDFIRRGRIKLHCASP